MKIYVKAATQSIIQQGIDVLKSMGLTCELHPDTNNDIIPLYKKSQKAKVEPYKGKYAGHTMYSFFIYADNNESVHDCVPHASSYAADNYDTLVKLNGGSEDFNWGGGRVAMTYIKDAFEAAFPTFKCLAFANGGLQGSSVGVSVLLIKKK